MKRGKQVFPMLESFCVVFFLKVLLTNLVREVHCIPNWAGMMKGVFLFHSLSWVTEYVYQLSSSANVSRTFQFDYNEFAPCCKNEIFQYRR